MKRMKYLILLTIFIFLLLIFKFSKESVKYEIGECLFALERNYANYDTRTKTFNTYVAVNCCGVNISVEKENNTYKILERQYGELCRCICYRKVVIYNVPENSDIVFINKDEGIIKLK